MIDNPLGRDQTPAKSRSPEHADAGLCKRRHAQREIKRDGNKIS
jgi:hypothetical protein